MAVTIVGIQASPWLLPLNAPFQVAQRTAYEARNVLVTVTASDGSTGHGGAAPVEYVTGETVQSVIALIEAAACGYEDYPIERLWPLLHRAHEPLNDAPSARAALEMALLDLWGKCWGLPLWHHFGASQTRLRTDLTIPIVEPESAGLLAQQAYAEGFTHLKVKVGSPQGKEQDLARIRCVCEGAPQAKLRIDANQAFDADGAVQFLKEATAGCDAIELIEQPVPQEDVAGLRFVRERCGVPVIADESAQSVADVRRLLEADAVDGVNIKIMKSGIVGAAQIFQMCRAWGKKTMIGCMLESRLGQAASVQLAAGLGGFDYIDLDAHRLLAPDGHATGGFGEEADTLIVEPNRPGWGVRVGEL
jgi:L-alanine-DL-glutamate epimerase-like enolase superfamily enzyme